LGSEYHLDSPVQAKLDQLLDIKIRMKQYFVVTILPKPKRMNVAA